MKSTQVKPAIVALLMSFSLGAQAHPGHDHLALSSFAIHSLTVLSIIAVGAFTVSMFRKHWFRVQNKVDNK